MRRQLAALATVAGFLLLAGCGGTSPTTPLTSPQTTPKTTPSGGGTAIPAQVFRARRVSAAYANWRLPYAIAREAVIDTGSGQVLLAGGMLPDDSSTGRAIRIDLAGGQTSAVAPLSTPVHDVAGGLYAGKPAVFGGGNATEQSVVQQFAGGTWGPITQLPTTRSDLSVVQVAGTTYVIGGYDGANVPTEILAVGAQGGLRPAGNLRNGVRYAATAVLDGRVYVFGGEVADRELGAVQRFDPATGHTAVVARLPRPLGHASAVAVGGRILLIGGRTGPNTMTDALWWFDPGTGRFTPAGHLPAATSDGAVAVLGHRAWLLGGETDRVVDRVIVLRFG